MILDKTIATLGAVAAEVYPEFNVFEVAKPYARQLVAERLSPRRLALRARREAQELTEIALEVPRQLHDVLNEMRDGEFLSRSRIPASTTSPTTSTSPSTGSPSRSSSSAASWARR